MKIWIAGIAVVILIALGILYGPHLGDEIVAIEKWIAGQGIWGPVVFAGLLVILTSVFFPESLLAAAAGALFGVPLGIAVVAVGAGAAQAVAFGISRRLLYDRVQRVLASRPKLAAVSRAVDREGLRMQLLLRLSPLSPIAVSYAVGVTRARFVAFLIACLGLVPGLFVEVYFGHTAKHLFKVAGGVSEHSTLHTALTVAGLFACVLVMVYVARLTRQALAGNVLE